MPESKLKPCPAPWAHMHPENIPPEILETIICVECPECGLCGPIKNTEAEAIAAWNSRQQSEIERLAVEVVPARTLFKRGNLAVGEQYDSALDALTAAVKRADIWGGH